MLRKFLTIFIFCLIACTLTLLTYLIYRLAKKFQDKFKVTEEEYRDIEMWKSEKSDKNDNSE